MEKKKGRRGEGVGGRETEKKRSRKGNSGEKEDLVNLPLFVSMASSVVLI